MAADLYSILAAGHGRDHIDGLNPGLRDAFTAMLAAAPPEIASGFGIQSGFRSPERQSQLYQAALQKYGSEQAARKWVAPPGRSQHNHGMAMDLSYASDAARKWAHENAVNFGLAFPMAHEPWHIELQGARGGKPGVGAPVSTPPAVAAQNPTETPEQPAPRLPLMPAMEPQSPSTPAPPPAVRRTDPGAIQGLALSGLDVARQNAARPFDLSALLALGRRPA